MPQRVAVPVGRAAARGTAMHPTAPPTLQRRRPARVSRCGSGRGSVAPGSCVMAGAWGCSSVFSRAPPPWWTAPTRLFSYYIDFDNSDLFDVDKIHNSRDLVLRIDISVVLFALLAMGVTEFFAYMGYISGLITLRPDAKHPELNTSNINFVFFLGVLSAVFYTMLPQLEPRPSRARVSNRRELFGPLDRQSWPRNANMMTLISPTNAEATCRRRMASAQSSVARRSRSSWSNCARCSASCRSMFCFCTVTVINTPTNAKPAANNVKRPPTTL